MKAKRSIFLLGLLVSIWGQPARSLDMSSIVSDTFGCTSCMDWRLSGMCFWLKCSITGCSIETSIRVSHNIPDVVIASFNGESPIDGFSYGDPTDGAVSSNDLNTVNFKNIQVIGNPAVPIYQSLWESTGLWCQSEATPLYPYYQSSWSEGFAGLSWNTNYIEQLQAVRYLFRNDVEGLGNLYPRCGWTVQTDDVKAAALTSLRAAHVITRSNQSHLYFQLDGDCGNRCWDPGEYDPDSPDSGKFQMLHPHSESQTHSLVDMPPGWTEGIYNDEKKYAWAFWRPYSCCQRKGSFLYSVEW